MSQLLIYFFMEHFRNKSNNSCYLLSNHYILDTLFHVYYDTRPFQIPSFIDEKNETQGA